MTDSKADEAQLNNRSTTEKESNEDDDLDYVDPTDAAQMKPDGNSSATTAARAGNLHGNGQTRGHRGHGSGCRGRGRGARGGRHGHGCGGHGQGRGNSNAVAQPPPLITWKDLDKDKEFTNTNSLKEFIEVPDVNRCAIPAESPLDNLLLFFPSEMIDQITIKTNLYHDQVNQGKEPKTNWIPVTKEKIKAFLGINIVNLREMKSYWAKGITRVPWFPSIMSRPRFEQICQYLHLADNSKQPDKDSKEYKLYKLCKIDEKVNEAATR